MSFLPVSKKEIEELGWGAPDFIIVTGDAYVDHPSFGIAIISRVLEARGFKVAIIPQPNPYNQNDFTKFGKPKLGFMVTSGNIDSMVSNYTVAKKRREKDAYSPGGLAGKRPDRAVIVYSRTLKSIYPDCPIIIGGLEASLRRFAHYDYWDDKVRPSILIDSKADLLIFGMGEKQTIQIADRLKKGENITDIIDIDGTCYAKPISEYVPIPSVECEHFGEVSKVKSSYARACRKQYDEQDAVRGKPLTQRHENIMVVQNKPMSPLLEDELDWVYSLPYERDYHPMYQELGGVPGVEEVKFSIVHNRGCFGACNFCSISFHQGRAITSRSVGSIIEEAKVITKLKGFKGYINDVGGPTANFRKPSCALQETAGLCKSRKCLAPRPCPKLKVDHSEYLSILKRIRELPGVKKVFVRSGIRFDYLMLDKDESFFKELVEFHVSGQLKVAPEHCCDNVLDMMGKPHSEVYSGFEKKFYNITNQIGKEQYLIPYLMSSHPGSTLENAVELALFLKRHDIRPQQVQDFYPTPGTISTCMFYTEINPYTHKSVCVSRLSHEKAMQRALLQYFNPKNKGLVYEALKRVGRSNLIGTGKNCLITGVLNKSDKPPSSGYRLDGGKKRGNKNEKIKVYETTKKNKR